MAWHNGLRTLTPRPLPGGEGAKMLNYMPLPLNLAPMPRRERRAQTSEGFGSWWPDTCKEASTPVASNHGVKHC